MRFTKPSFSRHVSRAVLATTMCGALSAAAASCSSDDDRAPFVGPDGVASLPDAADGTDASVEDALHDASAFDPTPPPIVCGSGPCVRSLSSISGGTQAFCVLLHDGTVACWGANDEGQLGRGDEAGADDSATPARVAGLADIVSLDRTCAVDKDGAAHCWGRGPYLNREATAFASIERTPVKLPIARVTKVSATSAFEGAYGRGVGCATVDDALQCWGSNWNGQVAPFGDGGVADVYGGLPVQTLALPAGRKVRDFVVGNATLVILDDGTTLSWGASPGRLTSHEPDPTPRPIPIPGLTTSIDVESSNACIAVAGIGYCWGAPAQLPVAVVAPEAIRQLATSDGASGTKHWCAVGTSGAVYCAGNNASGQAGDGTKDFAYEAVKVKGLPAPAVQVKVTLDSTCAVLTNGKVYCWGGDYFGQLGNGVFRTPSLIPQEVVLP